MASLKRMSTTKEQVDETDRLLDELEEIARSNGTNPAFHDRLLSSLRLLIGAESASLLIALPADSIVSIGSSGIVASNAVEELQAQLRIDLDSQRILSQAESPKWVAAPLLRSGFSTGYILMTFALPIPKSGLLAIESISKAFIEVFAIRHLSRVERFLETDWNLIQGLARQLVDSSSIQESAEMLANQLIPILSASRISVATTRVSEPKQARVIAISAVPILDRGAQLLKNLSLLAIQTFTEQKPIVRQSRTDRTHSQLVREHPSRQDGSDHLAADGTFQNLLGVKFNTNLGSPLSQETALILEWSSRDEMHDALHTINHFFPILSLAWEQNCRLLDTPKWLRFSVRRSPWQLVSKLSRSLILPTAFIAFLLIGFWLLTRPYPMTIQAESILEPISKRAIYANMDGFLDQLLVEDGQTVVTGQPVVKLRSPILDLQIEETNGQTRALAEKRNSLRVAINQLSPSSPDAEVVQTRISGEILMLETQEKHFREKQAYLLQEKKKLSVESPIDGIVVARNLRSELESRPLRRGDAMFNVVDLGGDWRLSIRVKDRDVNYIRKNYNKHPMPVVVIFDSIPGEQFRGQVEQIATTMENPQGTGSYLQLYASLDKEIASRAYMGANAKIFFECGEKPVWFVWCRPLIEEIQKRFWFFSDSQKIGKEGS
jgi:hypothetical protein